MELIVERLIELVLIILGSGALLWPLLHKMSRLTARPRQPGGGGGATDAGHGGVASVREGTGRTAVWLLKPGTQKIELIKVVRTLTGLGLKEAKDLVEGTPAAVFHHIEAAQAQAVREALEAAGGTVELRGGAGGAGDQAPAPDQPRTAAPQAGVAAFFDVVLLDPGVSPDRALAALEEALGLPREAAEACVMAAPEPVARSVTAEQADALRAALEAVGAQIAVRATEG